MRAALPSLVLFALAQLAATAAQSQPPLNAVRSAAQGSSPALDDCLKAAKSDGASSPGPGREGPRPFQPWRKGSCRSWRIW